MEEKQLEAIPMNNFRVLIYKVSIEDYVRKNWKNNSLKLDTDDDFFTNVDQEAMCKALVNAAWNNKNTGGLSSYNRTWAIKMVELGTPKDLEYTADIPVAALDQLITALRKLYQW